MNTNASPLTDIYDHWTRPSFEVRVRPASSTNPPLPMFLWGSPGINPVMTFDKPPILHIRNDTFGNVVALGTYVSGAQTPFGTLQPGECISIQLQNISGVYATCETESVVACLITS